MQISEYLWVPLATWAIAQSVKFFIAVFRGQYTPSLLFSSGGMPSVHSATVSSLATVALIIGGPENPLFGITGVVAAIVMYDSLGVRRSAGEQARMLNHLIDDLMQSGAIKTHKKYGHLREILGHRPLEVVIGATLGVLLAAAFNASTVLDRLPWLVVRPNATAMLIELILALFLMAVGILTWVLARRPQGRLASYRPFASHMAISSLVTALVLGFCLLVQRQQIEGWQTWFVLLVALMGFVFWHLGLWYRLLVDGALRTPVETKTSARREKWLSAAGKRRQKASK
ncbi:divergent PAP2 family protein [bacterium]|nr:divergent PAP2 family protein [bacterium]